MSDNDADDGSIYNDETEPDRNEQDSGYEYQSSDNNEENDRSSDEADSVKSKSGKKGKRSLEAGSDGKSTFTKIYQSRTYQPSKATYNDAYRNYYNDVVGEISDPLHSTISVLPASDIGLATWTPLEKEILFLKISTLGKDNIKGLSEAIRTKSETEVRQYVTLLDQGTIEGNVTKALPVFSAADVLAAFEVSKRSENLLEEYADGLARYQLKSDQKREEKRHGEYWLLTEEVAQDIEEQVMARDELYITSKAHNEEDDDLEGETKEKDTSREASERVEGETDSLEPEQEDHLDQASSQSQEPQTSSAKPAEELMVPAAELLDLPMWLRLSRLFMYQPPESGDSWPKLVTSRDETPSIYHTAFQDFHNLAISLTRRLVQATIFQAMTRLRAKDKDHPSAKMTSNDVRAAVEVLGMSPDMRKFWRGVPRRHGLRVYERSSKPSTSRSRAGSELGLEEVEKRMGASCLLSTTVEADDEVVHSFEHEAEEEVLDPDFYYDDPELWTEASESENEEPVVQPDDQQTHASEDEEDAAYLAADDEGAQEAAHQKRRRKGQMERNFEKAHDAYLEAVDQEMSRLHEVELWDALKVPPPRGIKDEAVEIPRQPVIKRRLSDNIDWRDNFEYRAPWEQDLDAVSPKAFARMHHRGERARKMRRLAYEHLEREGLIEVPRQEPSSFVVRKRTATDDVDVEMNDAPNDDVATSGQRDRSDASGEQGTIVTASIFSDGVPRKKLPNLALSIMQSRASSVREGSQESSRSASMTNDALSSQFIRRKEIEDAKRQEQLHAEHEAREAQKRLDEEEQEAKRQRDRDRKREAKALKALPDSERQGILEKRKEEKRRAKQEAKDAKRLTDVKGKQKIKGAKTRGKKHGGSLTETGEVAAAKADDKHQQELDEQSLEEQDVDNEATAADTASRSQQETPDQLSEQETSTQGNKVNQHQEAVDVEEVSKATRQMRSRSKKSKRQSGF